MIFDESYSPFGFIYLYTSNFAIRRERERETKNEKKRERKKERKRERMKEIMSLV